MKARNMLLADSRQQTADSRQQTADSRQQTAVILACWVLLLQIKMFFMVRFVHFEQGALFVSLKNGTKLHIN